jgi:hypothetical protein
MADFYGTTIRDGNTEIQYHARRLSDIGFDKYLRRAQNLTEDPTGSRYISARDLGGGIIGKGTVVKIGSDLLRIDGKKVQIVMSDGSNDRLLIGLED